MKLTIGIPTYNRNVELINLIKSLQPQLNDNIKVIIIDNCSTIPIKQSIEEAGVILTSNFSILENHVNIGGNANILRCFEYCETEWLWVIGDDDIPSPVAIKIILEKIEGLNNVAFLNFSDSLHIHKDELISNNIEEFVSNISNWGQINFTSISVFNAFKLKPYLRFGYQYAYSWSPHIATLLAFLAYNDSKVVFCAEKIISELCLAEDDNKWAAIGPNLGKMTLLELPFNFKTKKILADRISKKPAIECSIYEALNSIQYNNDIRSSYYLFSKMTERLYYFNRNPFFRIKILIYKLSFLFPNISLEIIKTILKIKGGDVTFISDVNKRL